MKHTVRSFSIGLLTAGVIMLIGFYFFGSESAQTKELTVNEMATLIEEEGYRIIAEEEYISLSVNNDNSSQANDEESEESTEGQDEIEEDSAEDDSTEDNNSNEESDEEENEDSEEEEEIITYTLNIEPGMTSSEFSSLLEENNIVEDASEFNQYIEDEDYSLRVQIGEFDLTSDMTIYEIAEEITR